MPGKKVQREDPEIVKARLEAKFAVMRGRLFEPADAAGICFRCHAPMPPGTTNAMLRAGEELRPSPTVLPE